MQQFVKSKPYLYHVCMYNDCVSGSDFFTIQSNGTLSWFETREQGISCQLIMVMYERFKSKSITCRMWSEAIKCSVTSEKEQFIVIKAVGLLSLGFGHINAITFLVIFHSPCIPV